MLDFKYTDFQEITYEDFLDLIWNNYVSEKIVSIEYYQKNVDFIRAITYDSFRMFQMDNTLTIRHISKMYESFFFNAFRYAVLNTDIC